MASNSNLFSITRYHSTQHRAGKQLWSCVKLSKPSNSTRKFNFLNINKSSSSSLLKTLKLHIYLRRLFSPHNIVNTIVGCQIRGKSKSTMLEEKKKEEYNMTDTCNTGHTNI